MKNSKINLLFIFPSAFLSTYAIYLFWFEQNARNGKQIIWLFLFCVLSYFMYKAFDKDVEFAMSQTPQLSLSAALSMLFSLFYVVGKHLHIHGNLHSILPGGEYFSQTMTAALGFFCLFFSLLQMLFSHISTMDFKQNSVESLKDNKIFILFNEHSFLSSWVLIMLCWIPYLIALAPGVLTYDSIQQELMIAGNIPFTNHHPAIHTFAIAFFMKLGAIFSDNPNVGVLLYSLFQMLAMSAIFAYLISYLTKHKLPFAIRIAVLTLFALLPIHALYSLTMWKDILFGGLTLLVCIQIFELIRDAESYLKSKMKVIMLTLLLFLFSTWRNNGFYVFFLMIPILGIAFRKHLKQMAVILLVPLILYGIYKGPLFNAFDIQEGSTREALSVPLQQIARTVRDYKDEITQEEREMIDKYLPFDIIGEKYKPYLSDPVKNKFNDEAFAEDKTTLIKVWFELFTRYPLTYVESFLCNNYGYWFPDVNYWICAYTIYDSDLGIQQTGTGAESMQGFFESCISFPVISMLFSIGFSFWLLCICAVVVIMKKRKALLIPIAMLFFLWLTTIASPVYSEFRYIYGMIVSVPLCICMTLTAEHFPKIIKKQEKPLE